jgi:hypothetical protein
MVVKDLYNENYKKFNEGLKKTLENGRTLHVHGLAELIL